MRRLLKWSLRIVGVGGVVAAVLLALYVTALPGIVERRAVAALREMGLTGASLEVRAVSLGGAEAANVRLDEQGRVRIYSLAALYDLAALRNGRVGTIEVTGAELGIALRDGRLDLGPLADLEGSDEGGGEGLPFDRILLHASVLRLDLEGRETVIPVSGSIQTDGASLCTLDLRAAAEGSTLHLSGSIDTNTKAIALSAEGAARDVAGPLSALPPSLLRLPGRLGGGAAYTVSYTSTEKGSRVAVTAKGEGGSFVGDVEGRRLMAEGVSWRLETHFEPPFRPSALTGDVTAAAASVDGVAVRKAAIHVEKRGEALAFSASAEGDGWRLETLTGEAGGLLDLLDGAGSSARVEASWSGRARVPERVAEAMRARGLELAGLGEATTTGRATLDVAKAQSDAGERWTWKAAARDVRVAVAPGRLRATLADAGLRDVAADLRLEADADAEGLRLALLPESRVTVGSATANGGGVGVSLTEGSSPCVVLSIAGQPATLRVTPGSEEAAWQLDAPGVRVAAGSAALTAGEGALRIERIRLDARLRVTAGPGRAVLALLPGTKAEAGWLTAGAAGVSLSRAEDEGPLLRARLERQAEMSLATTDDGLAWAATVPELIVAVGPSPARMRAAGVEAKGVMALARLSLAADAKQAAVGLLPGSMLAIGDLLTPGLNVLVEKVEAGEPLLAVEAGGEGGRLTAALGGKRLDWQATLDTVTATLAEADVETRDGALTLRGVRAALSLRMRAARGEAALSAPDGWTIGLRSAAVKAGEETIRVGETRLTVESLDGRPLASVAFGGGETGFRLAAQAKAAGPVTATVGEETAATVATLRASVEASRDPEGTSLAAELVAEGIDTTVDRAFGGLTLVASTRGGSLRVSMDGRGVVDEVGDLPLFTDAAIEAGKGRAAIEGGFGRIDTSFDSASLSGWAGLERGRRPTADARLTLRGASCNWPELQLALSGLSADIPVRLNTSGDTAGRFAVGGVRFRRSDLPGLSGTLALTDGRVDVGAAWPLLKDAALHAEGRVDLRSGVPLGTLRAWMPRVVIEDEMELAGLLRDAQGIDLSGAVELDATFELLVDRVIPHVVVKAEDVTVGSKQYDTKIEGLTASITLNSLKPFATPSHQRIEVARANVGGLAVKDGVVDFRLESLDAVFIERCEFGWAGGRLYTYALRFDPAEPIDLVVYGEKLSLAELLALIPDDRAAGKGTLYGRLPVTVSWPQLRFGEGFLYGTPGERGWVSLKKDAALLASGLPAGGGQTLAGDVLARLRRRLEAALKDFEYDVFKTDFVREGGALVARVALTGRGPEVKPELPEPTLLGRVFPPRYDVRTLRQEFAPLVLRFPRIDEILSKAIIVKTGIEREAEDASRKGGTP